MNMNMNSLMNIDEKAWQLLHPHSVLPEFLFDGNQTMFVSVRRQLLEQAEFVIRKTVALFPGLDVSDIVLAGSLASYLYHDQSDYDVSILVKNKGCPFLPRGEHDFTLFLTSLLAAWGEECCNFSVNGRHVDFSFFDEAFDAEKICRSSLYHRMFGLYSLQNNRWLSCPSSVADADISIASLVSGYFEKLEEFYDFMAGLPMLDNVYTSDSLQKMYTYYYRLRTDFTYSSNKNYLINKLLSSEGVLQEIGRGIVNSYVRRIMSGNLS